jgi:4-hydroxy-3-methylbut-2-enyl diphosphate reductase
MVLVETPEEAETLVVPPHDKLAVVTQTTLSVDEVEQTMAVLRRRFPHLSTPAKEDICYATTNRQGAVKRLAARCRFVIVVGSRTSSNSNRLKEVAEAQGARSVLIMGPEELDRDQVCSNGSVGITSGASTPEKLVEDVIGKLLEWAPGAVVEVLETVREDLEFRPHRELVQLAMAKSD